LRKFDACLGNRPECVDEVRKHRKRIPRAVGIPFFKIVAGLSHRIGDVGKAKHQGNVHKVRMRVSKLD
jgi:hypothetical protein